LGQAKNMRLIKCQKFSEPNTARQTFGTSKVCAQVSTKTPELIQFSSDQKMSEKEVALIFILRGPCFLIQAVWAI
jgi:hypothetical protein